jgi:uncharacterized protein (TIGR03382 family)
MRRVLLIGALLALGCDDRALVGRSLEPIIGGQPSLAGEYPETGVLLAIYDFGGGQQFGSLLCSGTLIAPDVVMMAGHCTLDFFDGQVPSKNYFSFALDVSEFGMSTLELPPDAIEFNELVPHPMFDFNTMPPPGLGNYYDVGLGFLKEPFIGVTPGVVADDQDAPRLAVNLSVQIVGYGQTDPNDMVAGVKYQAVTFINEINPNEMQIGNVPPGDPQKCHGDSGGPTFADIDDGRAPLRRTIGITSRAYDDADCNKGGIDMRADAFRSWFDQTMRDRCTASMRPADQCANGGGLPLPGGMLPPPPDAGFPDTGEPEDTGVAEKDASQVADAGEVEDAGSSVDAATTPTPRRKKGCGCASTREEAESSASLLPLIAAAVALLGSRRRGAR